MFQTFIIHLLFVFVVNNHELFSSEAQSNASSLYETCFMNSPFAGQGKPGHFFAIRLELSKLTIQLSDAKVAVASPAEEGGGPPQRELFVEAAGCLCSFRQSRDGKCGSFAIRSLRVLERDHRPPYHVDSDSDVRRDRSSSYELDRYGTECSHDDEEMSQNASNPVDVSVRISNMENEEMVDANEIILLSFYEAPCGQVVVTSAPDVLIKFSFPENDAVSDWEGSQAEFNLEFKLQSMVMSVHSALLIRWSDLIGSAFTENTPMNPATVSVTLLLPFFTVLIHTDSDALSKKPLTHVWSSLGLSATPRFSNKRWTPVLPSTPFMKHLKPSFTVAAAVLLCLENIRIDFDPCPEQVSTAPSDPLPSLAADNLKLNLLLLKGLDEVKEFCVINTTTASRTGADANDKDRNGVYLTWRTKFTGTQCQTGGWTAYQPEDDNLESSRTSGDPRLTAPSISNGTILTMSARTINIGEYG